MLSDGEARDLVDSAIKSGGGVNAAQPTAFTSTGNDEAVADAASVGRCWRSWFRGVPRSVSLLPLSGNYASYGESSRRGVELAFAESGIELVVRDTQGESHLARAAVDELAADPSVVAVIGPLRSKVAQAVTPRAERAGLPLVSLAQRKSISGRYVLQTAMTEEDAGFATGQLRYG